MPPELFFVNRQPCAITPNGKRDAYFVSTIATPSGSRENLDAVPGPQGVADEQVGMTELEFVFLVLTL